MDGFGEDERRLEWDGNMVKRESLKYQLKFYNVNCEKIYAC